MGGEAQCRPEGPPARNWSPEGPKTSSVIYLRNPVRKFTNYSSDSLSSDKLNFVGDKKWVWFEVGKSIHDASLPLWRALKTRGELSQSEKRRPGLLFQKPKSSKKVALFAQMLYAFCKFAWTEIQLKSNTRNKYAKCEILLMRGPTLNITLNKTLVYYI